MTVKNTDDKTKNIKLFSFMEFCLWNAYDDMTNFQRNFSIGEVEVQDSVIYHKTEYREHRNHYAFYSVNEKINSFDTDRDNFLGAYNGFDAPASVANGNSQNSIASGWTPIVSHCINISLELSEKKQFVFLLGYVENNEEEKWESPNIINKTKAIRLINEYDTVEKVGSGFLKLK